MTVDPLLYADSERSADLLYFGRVSVMDPFLAFGAGRRKIAVVKDLEYARVRRTSRFTDVLSLEEIVQEARAKWPGRDIGPAEVIASATRRFGPRRFAVPADFSVELYQRIRRLGVKARIAKGPLFPERECKERQEVAAIARGYRCAAQAIDEVRKVLGRTTIKQGTLFYRGKVLRSEDLREVIDITCLRGGGVASLNIAAGGNQACDPHESGFGPLRAGQLIIVDVGVRMKTSGYWGDMTRTFLRGTASDAQRRLVRTVTTAEKMAIAQLTPGADGRSIHRAVQHYFSDRGYRTLRTKKGATGFFHATGHNIGLEIHENPVIRNGTTPVRIIRGAVVAIEPALYYPGLGACRVEDGVEVRRSGPRLVASYPYDWELR